MKKAEHYWEKAVMMGNVMARHNLGNFEEQAGNMDKALKHYMIAAREGSKNSLTGIKELFLEGHATKDDYAEALRVYQEYADETRSEQRDEAAAYDATNKYY